MKEKITQYANDTALAFGTGAYTDSATESNNIIVVAVVSILAPIIRDCLTNLLSRVFKKKEK